MNFLTKRGILLITPLVVAIVAVIGGGAGAAATVATSSATKGQFLKSANAICAKGKKQALTATVVYAEKHKGGSKKGGDPLGRAYQKVLLPRIQGQINAIRALDPSRSKQGKVGTSLAALQQAVNTGEDVGKPSAAKIEKLLKPPAKLARDAGLDECAYG